MNGRDRLAFPGNKDEPVISEERLQGPGQESLEIGCDRGR